MGDRNTLSYGFPSSSQPREQLHHCQRSRHQAFAGSLLKIRMGELGKAAIAFTSIGSGALPARPGSFQQCLEQGLGSPGEGTGGEAISTAFCVREPLYSVACRLDIALC